jgi:hypothetical protein
MRVYPFDHARVWTRDFIDLDDSWRSPLNPLEFAWPHSTTPRDPEGDVGTLGAHEAAQLNADGSLWAKVADFRGTSYWTAERVQHTITEVGVVAPADALDADPGPTLDERKAAKLEAITQACAVSIVSGFTSNALGADNFYPSGPTDQVNLTASVAASREPGLPDTWRAPFYCRDAAGNWARVPHTAAQIQRVGMDGYNTIIAKMAVKDALEVQIMNATTAEEVDALQWPAT